MKILPDHVHMLIQIPPRDSVAHVMQILKGGTSKKLRDEFPELEEFLGGTASGPMATLPSQLVRSVKQLFASTLRTKPQVCQRNPEAPTFRSGEWVH